MKNLVLVLAVALIVAPSFGALNLTLERQGTTNLVDLKYNDADVANLPRAFGLAVAIDGVGTIDAITGFKTGESTAASKGFGIYPATIVIDSCGVPTSWGTPLAATGDPGALDQVLPSNGFVVEFGSLYVGDTNAPATSGTLCTFEVNANGSTSDITISVTEENTYRGGVVLEDGTVPSPDLTASLVYDNGCSPMPVAATTPTPANSATCISKTVALTWAPAAGGTNPKYDVYIGQTLPTTPTVSNLTSATYSPAGLVAGKTYYWKVVSKNDCDAVGVSSATWNFKVICKGDYNASGDVTPTDIAALVTYYNLNKNAFNKAPLTGTGYVCSMDINGDGFVTPSDIAALVTYYNLNKNAFNKAPCMP